jgi:hypothetical protein
VLLVDGVHTLIDVIIADRVQVDLVSRVVFFCGVATIVVVQVKDDFYCDRFSIDMFSPLIMDVYISRWTNFFIDVPTWHGE